MSGWKAVVGVQHCVEVQAVRTLEISRTEPKLNSTLTSERLRRSEWLVLEDGPNNVTVGRRHVSEANVGSGS
jgi:hypothetical protein